MSSRKLDVGTIVHFLRASLRARCATYRIEERLLLEGGSVLYRIKCDAEPFDRIVAESDLVCS